MNAATQYGVQIVRANETEYVWRCTSVRHLTPSENRGKHSVYVDVLDEHGNRDRNPSLRIGWLDHDGDTTPSFTVLDKPDTSIELGDGNVDLYLNQTMTVWLSGHGYASDSVTGIHSRHADELGPNGETWNSYGHHSFKVVFQKQRLLSQPDEGGKDDGSNDIASDYTKLKKRVISIEEELHDLREILRSWVGD